MADDSWQDSYEKLWNIRHGLIKNFIEAGETDAFRLINLFEWYSRHYGNSGPIDHANNPNGFPLLPTGVPAFRQIPVQDHMIIAPYYGASLKIPTPFIGLIES